MKVNHKPRMAGDKPWSWWRKVDNPRKIVFSIRVNQAEKDMLISHFGDRGAIRDYLLKQIERSKGKKVNAKTNR